MPTNTMHSGGKAENKESEGSLRSFVSDRKLCVQNIMQYFKMINRPRVGIGGGDGCFMYSAPLCAFLITINLNY